MAADQLYDMYTSFGEDPFIVCLNSTDEPVSFSAWDYAKQQSALLTPHSNE
jgi:hypothetical protein